MNTRDLTLGLTPTEEYERKHIFATFRQFPDLRQSIAQVDGIALRGEGGGLRQLVAKKKSMRRVQKSTHRLDELSQSSIDELSTMSDFRRQLIESRHAHQPRQPAVDESSVVSMSTDCFSENYDPLVAADRKLTKVSLTFDSQSYNSHLAGFAGARLDKAFFKTQLRRCLNINLRAQEFEALFEKMDADHSQEIDGVEFIRYFFALGIEARWKLQMETVRRSEKKEIESQQRRLAEEARVRQWEASQITSFTDADSVAAMEKLSSAALKWDPANTEASIGFEAHLTPYEFKVQLIKSFGIKLSGSEIGALIKQFSTRPGDHCIDGYLFLKRFFALHKRAAQIQAKSLLLNKLRKDEVMAMGNCGELFPQQLGR